MRTTSSFVAFTFAALLCQQSWGAEPAKAPATEPGAEETTSTPKPEPAATIPSIATEPTVDEAADAVSSDASPPVAETQSPEPVDSELEARAAFHRGDRLYLEGDYEGAVKAFEEAYALSGRIEMLFNLANAHERLGNYDKASVALRGYIPHSPASTRAALEKRLDRFEELATKRQQKAEKTAEVVKELKENPRPFPLERTVGIGLLTLGSAAVLTGTGFGISALGARAKLNDACETGASGRLCPPDAQEDLNRDRAHSTVADVAILSGLVGATIGTVLIVHSKNKEARKLDLEIEVGAGNIRLGGSF